MVDVSSEGECTITPINPTSLSTAGGVLPNGTENVMMRCNCTDDDGIVINTVRWYYPDGRLVPRFIGSSDSPNTPHITRPSDDTDDRNVTLVIPTFNDSYDGKYTCGRRITDGPPVPPTVAVNLTVSSELFVRGNIINPMLYGTNFGKKKFLMNQDSENFDEQTFYEFCNSTIFCAFNNPLNLSRNIYSSCIPRNYLPIYSSCLSYLEMNGPYCDKY